MKLSTIELCVVLLLQWQWPTLFLSPSLLGLDSYNNRLINCPSTSSSKDSSSPVAVKCVQPNWTTSAARALSLHRWEMLISIDATEEHVMMMYGSSAEAACRFREDSSQIKTSPFSSVSSMLVSFQPSHPFPSFMHLSVWLPSCRLGADDVRLTFCCIINLNWAALASVGAALLLINRLIN